MPPTASQPAQGRLTKSGAAEADEYSPAGARCDKLLRPYDVAAAGAARLPRLVTPHIYRPLGAGAVANLGWPVRSVG